MWIASQLRWESKNQFQKEEQPMAQPLKKIEPDRQILTDDRISVPSLWKQPVYQSYKLLHFGYVLLPVIAGADKFNNRLVDWTQYLAPEIPRTLHVSPKTFMRGVGVVEITAGIGVFFKPRIFGYVVSAWLLGIIGNLLLKREYLDIALRDFGLAIGAEALGRMSSQLDPRELERRRTSICWMALT
jgi:hypothetical protein